MRFCQAVLIFLALPLFILLGCDNRRKSESPRPAVEARPSAQDIEKQDLDTLLQSLKEKNPFRPDHTSRYTGSNIQPANILKGIVWDSDRPYAIIGNRVVIEGDDIDNKKVIRIERDSVTLESEGKEEVLKL